MATFRSPSASFAFFQFSLLSLSHSRFLYRFCYLLIHPIILSTKCCSIMAFRSNFMTFRNSVVLNELLNAVLSIVYAIIFMFLCITSPGHNTCTKLSGVGVLERHKMRRKGSEKMRRETLFLNRMQGTLDVFLLYWTY